MPYATATPTAVVSSPASGERDYLCVAPGFGARVIAATSWVAARQAAMVELGCDVVDLSVERNWE